MIPRTSRTGTLRAASVACAASVPGRLPLLTGIPLLVGACLAALWLLCAAPAQADTGSSTALGTQLSETATGEALGLGEPRPLGNLEGPSLERIVPAKVTEPVVATLDTVHQGLEQGHQRLEKGTIETAAAASALAEPAVAEVRGEVRGFVSEIDRDREEAGARGLVHTLPTSEQRPPRQEGENAEESGAEDRSEDDERSSAPDSPTSQDAPAPHAVSGQLHHTAPAAQTVATSGHEGGAADRAPEHRRVQPTTGSPAPPASGQAPGPSVAGYLTAAPLPAPAADAGRLATHRLHSVPADAADDLTVSPD